MPDGNYSSECKECKLKRRTAKFNTVCPALYLDTDASRLPQRQLKAAMEWKYSKRGLLLLGDTGKGKTRVAWTLLKRVLTEDLPERQLQWFDCVGFGQEVGRHYRLEDAEDWLTQVAKADLVFFDDLGKLKLTERAETELFGIVERRCASCLPLIITTNDNGDSLGARMTENRGPAMIRRLREFCHAISF